MRFRTLIVEDDSRARARLRRLLQGAPEFELVGEHANGPTAAAAIVSERPHLLFLSPAGSGPDGFAVLDVATSRQPPAVVIITAQPRQAVRAFDMAAVDCLPKPLRPDRLALALDRARAQLTGGVVNTTSRSNHPVDDRMTVRAEGRLIPLRFADIAWLGAAGNYVRFHVRGAAHLVHGTLSAFHERLPRGQFLRVSRSAIVNQAHLVEIESRKHGDHVVVLRSGDRVAASRTFRSGLAKLLKRQR